MGYFNDVLATFLDLAPGNSIAVYGRVRELSDSIKKYLNLCFEDERRSYGFGMTWGWGWTMCGHIGKILPIFSQENQVHWQWLSLVSPKFFFLHFCHRWSFGSLPLLPLACLFGDAKFLAILSAWLHDIIGRVLNWMITSLNQQWTDFNWKINCL